jgi:DNA-binding NtrC family response regulator
MDIVTLPKRKARVLVVEDGITMRMFYRDVLEAAGFEVEEAVNGLEGVERAMTGSSDLLVVESTCRRWTAMRWSGRFVKTSLWRVPVSANFYLTKPAVLKDLVEMRRFGS